MSSEWTVTTLGAVSTWASGGTPKKDVPSYWDGDIPWISANSMHATRFSDSELRITEAGLKNGSRLALKDSVLLLVRGSALHSRVPVGVATRDVAFNQDVKAIIAKPGEIRPWYLLYWLMGNEKFLLETVVEYTGIGAGKLDTKRMQGLELLLPPLLEQDEILQVIKSVDDRIALLRETNATLEAIA
jgi:type I restriction enzyme S subunit